MLMTRSAFAAVTQRSAPPIDMVMPYMFMLTYVFSFQKDEQQMHGKSTTFGKWVTAAKC